MKTLGVTLSAEWARCRFARSTFVAGVTIFLLAFLRVVFEYLKDRAAWAEKVQAALLRGANPPESPPIGNAFGPWIDGWRTGIALGAILLLVFAARSLAGDDERGLARIQLTRGASRFSATSARMLVGMLLIPIVVAIAGFGSFSAAALFFRFEALVQDGYELASVDVLTSEITVAVLASLPPLIATFAFGLFVSSWSRTSAAALVVALLALLGFDLFREVLGEAQYWVFPAYTPSFVDKSCLREASGVARGFFDRGYTDVLLRWNFLFPTAQALVLFLASLFFYKRRAL